jgi:phosphoglycerol transferase
MSATTSGEAAANPRWREVSAYVVVAALALLAAVWVLQAWRADLRVPFVYGADSMAVGAGVKGMIDTGWVETNRYLGLPGQQNMGDFPPDGTLQNVLLKLVSIPARSWGLTINLFFLLCFPLTAVLAFWSLRRLSLSRVVAGAMSVLYALLPYHFFRGETHLALGAYFLVPPMIVVVLWSMGDSAVLFGDDPKSWKIDLRRPEPIIALSVCVLTGIAGIYYAFFACLFLALAGIIAWARHGKLRLAVSAALLIGVIVIVGAINLSPSIVYHLRAGSNPGGLVRNPGQAELDGLKIDQMFLPIDGHRIGALARLKATYHAGQAHVSRWLDNEAVTTSPLGILGAVGLLLALVWPFLGDPAEKWAGRERHTLLQRLGQLEILGLLVATAGGFGAMIAFVLPLIRSYNRIVVFIAFFAFAALGLVLDRLAARAKPGLWRGLALACVALVLVFGVLDQTGSANVPDYPAVTAAFRADAAFVSRIEKSLPPGSAVFELPYMPFPEPGGPLVKMQDYEPLRGYLHSSALRWSYGAQKGRSVDAWQRTTAALPPAEMVRALLGAGFDAVWVDRNGYADNGAAIEAELARITGSRPLVSDDGQLAVYALGRQ